MIIPISLSADTIKKLGLFRIAGIGFSYIRRVVFPLKEEKNLEQFFINRFGEKLYRTFFKSYTEKVWGVPCTQIDAEWGGPANQRAFGLEDRQALPQNEAVAQAFGGIAERTRKLR